jgi:endonuclease/exonuclease/phosphatase family metal-dependent hydrolase
MLNSLNPNDWDIIALQEPYINFNGVTCATPPWRVAYPSRHYSFPGETRLVMLLNKKLATNFWEALPTNSSDITAIRLLSDFGQVRIFNIYNDCTHSRTLECLEHYLLTSPAVPVAEDILQHDIWVGDFNRHDPMWESPDNPQLFTTANIDAAEILINILANFAMNMVLEPGIPTLEHMVTKNLHQVNHIFCSQDLSPRFIHCEVLPHEWPPKTDHFPIVSTIDLQLSRTREEPKRNFREMDWDEFRDGLKVKLSDLELRKPQNTAEFDAILEKLSSAITSTCKGNPATLR